MKFFRDVFKTRDITDSKEIDLTAYNISVIMVRIFIIAFIFLTVSLMSAKSSLFRVLKKLNIKLGEIYYFIINKLLLLKKFF